MQYPDKLLSEFADDLAGSDLDLSRERIRQDRLEFAVFRRIHPRSFRMIPFQFDGNPKHDGMTYQSWVDAYNEILPLYLRDIPNVEIVDISDLYLDENGKAIPERMDGILVHPNTEGYILWGERLAPLIQSLTVPVILSTHSPEEQAIVGGRILEMDKL